MYRTTHAATTFSGLVVVMARVHMLCVPVLVLAMAAAALAQERAEEQVVNLYSWADYVAPETLRRFEQETGIHVRYDTFDAPEVLETKLLTGGSGYDVVVPSSSVLARGLAAGALKACLIPRAPWGWA